MGSDSSKQKWELDIDSAIREPAIHLPRAADPVPWLSHYKSVIIRKGFRNVRRYTGCMFRVRHLMASLVLVLAGCAPEPQRVGVLVGPASETYGQIGEIAMVEAFDEASDAYEIVLPDGETTDVVPPGLIRVFPSPNAARRWITEAGPILGRTMYATVNALRVRTEPNLDSEVVYRLRVDEPVSLVAESDHQSTINGRQGPWYQVIAGQQYRGWAFGPLLSESKAGIVDRRRSNPDSVEVAVETLLGDDAWVSSAAVDSFARGGQSLFALRLSRDTIQFTDGTSQLGFPTKSASRENGTFSIAVADGSETLFLEPRPDCADTVVSQIHATIVGERGELTGVLQSTERTWNGILAETTRRNRLAEQFFAQPGVYRSATYGDLVISADGTIRWVNNEVIVPEVLPSPVVDPTAVRFVPAISDDLADDYGGAITVDLPRDTDDPIFLVSILSSAIRLVWDPGFSTDGSTVSSPPVSPVVMYFKRTIPAAVGDSGQV